MEAVCWLRLAIETTGAVIVALGLVIALGAFVRAFRERHGARYATDGYNGGASRSPGIWPSRSSSSSAPTS